MRELELARKEAENTKEVYFEPEIHRVRAETLLALGDNPAAAESFRRSYQIALQLKEKPLQLRAALAAYSHRNEVGVTEEEALSLLRHSCSEISTANGDPEVRTARGIIGTSALP
jgi:hypothetical protein